MMFQYCRGQTNWQAHGDCSANLWDHYLRGYATVNVDQLGRRGNRLSCGRGLRGLSQGSRRRDGSERRSPFFSLFPPPSARVPPGADVRGVRPQPPGSPLTPRCYMSRPTKPLNRVCRWAAITWEPSRILPIRRRSYGALIRSGEIEPSGDYGLERRRTPSQSLQSKACSSQVSPCRDTGQPDLATLGWSVFFQWSSRKPSLHRAS